MPNKALHQAAAPPVHLKPLSATKLAVARCVEKGRFAMQPRTNLDLLSELCNNANLGKYRHFHAAEEKNSINSFIGVAVIVVNLALGSAFFVALTQELAVYAKWTAGFLGLLAAIGSSLQTFFGFPRKVEGYRRIANRYLSLARECQFLQTQFHDGLVDLPTVSERLGELLDQYSAINVEAENFPTGKRQYKTALKLERQRQGWLEREYGAEDAMVDGAGEDSPRSAPQGSPPEITRADSWEDAKAGNRKEAEDNPSTPLGG